MTRVAAVKLQHSHHPFRTDRPLDECRKDKSHDVFAGEDMSCPDAGGVCKPADGARNINDEALTH